MIEVLFVKAWRASKPVRGKLWTDTLDFLHRLPSKRNDIALTVAIPALVCFWHLAVLAARPSHLNKIVSVLGSATIGRFATIMSDNSGTRLVFMQGAENGYDLFLCNVGGGKKKFLDEDPYSHPSSPHQTLLGWSPDDQFFAFSRYNTRWEIVICDGNSGAALATVPVNERVTFGTWLSPQTFAFSTQSRVLYTIHHSQKEWLNPQPFTYFTNRSHKLSTEPIQNLVTFDANTVTWKQGNSIWSCSKDSDAPTIVWDSATNTLINFSFSQTANKCLVQCRDPKGQFLANFPPNHPDEFNVIARINTNKYNPIFLGLINDGKGYVFMSQIGTSNTMVTKMDDSHAPVPFQWPDQYSRFVVGQHEVFVASSLSHGPTGIWQYNVASGSAECVVPRTEDMDYLTNGPVEWHQITNAAGEKLTYYLYVPAGQPVTGKHPLIMGVDGLSPVGFAWYANYQAFADCGYFYIYAERYQRDDSQWGQDLLAVYENVAKRPDIDTNRVYLLGISAGAGSVCELLREEPKLWRGALFFSPVDLPEASEISVKRLFIDGGGDDPGLRKSAIKFQDAAAKTGIPVTLLIHPGLGHMLNRMPSAERERLRETLIFLNEP